MQETLKSTPKIMHVTAKFEPLVIPTYPVGKPEKNPVFFEKRVYQGSNGKVYPVPFIDKVYDIAKPVSYRSTRLENEYVRLVMLPEIGGRIFLGQDKSNSDYDFFYRQDVIKPALVGLAGPWISGGVEFNWPQHHRPGTFMPCDTAIEEEPCGARTVWFSEHDPIHRLKGMHGIRLRPGSSLIELRGRLYNRTAVTRTFLWWANVAALVHGQYQSFFPPDVHYVADHAVRAISTFPHARQPYYGVAYQERQGADDLSWYKNIPVPTSYMICQTRFDFFGGYDYVADGGFIHVADRHVAPGKKQWTWGDHGFGHAWDRELTDTNGPYIELMAGVYTDNQPDFTYLLPYETKTFSQFWWPIQGLGPVQNANTRVAIRLVVGENRTVSFGVAVSEKIPGARVVLKSGEKTILDTTTDLTPGPAWRVHHLEFNGDSESSLSATVIDASGEILLAYRPVDPSLLTMDRQQATEPPPPAEISGSDELFLTGEHLEQYRHPTRDPESYWNEALRRDPGDSRCNTALGRRALERGEFAGAEAHFRSAIGRFTFRHPNPVSGEAHYYLGITLRHTGNPAARDFLAKAAWNYEWRAAANYQLAAMDATDGSFHAALAKIDEALETNSLSAKFVTLRALILQKLGRVEEAAIILRAALATDPLDHWARWTLEGGSKEFAELSRNDAQTILDLAFDFLETGFRAEALKLIRWHSAHPTPQDAVPNPLSASPMMRYLEAYIADDAASLAVARGQSPDYFFPSRIEEMRVLEWALAQPGHDPAAAYALGNFYYDRRRHEDAIHNWERSVSDGADFPTVFRNLGIAYWNVRHDGAAARAAYQQARQLDPTDARLLSEYDQLRKKLNEPIAHRLSDLESQLPLAMERDDCAVELAALYNLSDRPTDALALLESRRFHPWEGGEGKVLRQYTAARIALGRKALAEGNSAAALAHFQRAMKTPENLGEAYHLLQAKADVNYWLGMAAKALGNNEAARIAFEASASEAGDFSNMSVVEHSPLTWHRAQALHELGKTEQARKMFRSLLAYAERKMAEPAKIDYFATSLPNLLVFDEDLQARAKADAWLLSALANHGLGKVQAARIALENVIAFDRADQHVAELSAIIDNAPNMPG